MKIGIFSDTYFPQVSGVSTSIKTLKDELENRGHEVYIFTTTDPNAPRIQSGIVRMPSIPFVSFKDRRIVVRGMRYAYLVAKEIGLDIVHTHTEFGTGMLGKFVAKHLHIPAVHTYHTMYEDYLHYVAKGYLIRPGHVERYSRMFCRNLDGVVCPSQRVVDTLQGYEIEAPMSIIPTGINVRQLQGNSSENTEVLRESIGISPEDKMLLSLSRLSFEKNIQGIIVGMPRIIQELPQAKLVIVGDGPYREDLEQMTASLGISSHVKFIGEVPNEEVGKYYRSADFFLSCSSSESQGLTYAESLAAGTPCIVKGNEYLESLIDHPSLGVTFKEDKDLAPAVLQYIQQNLKINQEILQKKLYEISSQNFGEKVCQMYLKAQEHFMNEQITEKYEESKEKVKLFRRTEKNSQKEG